MNKVAHKEWLQHRSSANKLSFKMNFVEKIIDAGTVADMAATRKTEKYSTLSSTYRFQPT